MLFSVHYEAFPATTAQVVSVSDRASNPTKQAVLVFCADFPRSASALPPWEVVVTPADDAAQVFAKQRWQNPVRAVFLVRPVTSLVAEWVPEKVQE